KDEPVSITATLIVQIIVFLLLVAFTMKFVWPPIAAALDERAKKIAEGLAAADKAKAELADADKRVEQELAKSRADTAQMLADAEALYKSPNAELSGASNWLDALAAVAANSQLLQFADNPKVSAQQVFDVISDVARVQLPAAGQNFLRAVIDNGRLAALPEIAH